MATKLPQEDLSGEVLAGEEMSATLAAPAALEQKDAVMLKTSASSERIASGLLARLLELTRDAALAFDGAGHIMLANDEAERLLGHMVKQRLGIATIQALDIRMLFPPAVGLAPSVPFKLSDLPFSVDGSSQRLLCAGIDGHPFELSVRADRVPAASDTYLLVASLASDEEAAERERQRLLEELSRANRRLSGTLKIVLSTIDASDVGSLFASVLQEITETLEATGSLLYLAENEGFRLYGVKSKNDTSQMRPFFSPNRSFERRLHEIAGSLRLRVLEPTREELRQGKLKYREVIDSETRETFRVPASVLPPYRSFLLAPVWFGGQIIAGIVVGWEFAKQIRRDDAQLLDAVASYLSVQLAGAVATLHQQRESELAELGTKLRGLLLDAGSAAVDASFELEGDTNVDPSAPSVGLVSARTNATEEPIAYGRQSYERICSMLADALRCTVVLLVPNMSLDEQGCVANLPVHGQRVVPEKFLHCDNNKEQSSVISFNVDDELGQWLDAAGEPSQGALIDLGSIGDTHRALLLLRDAEFEPFDELELGFLRRLAEDARDAVQVEQARERDRHISQALQTGMKNELQKVPGIAAAGLYTSATKSAFVGGDFYDLIRLPKDRACVIMGDVSGKGVEAASVSAAVKTALGAYSWEGLSPARMVRLLNEFLIGFTRLETFATLFVGIIDSSRSELTYCSAGHPPALLARAQTGDLSTLDVQSGVVGAFREMEYRNGTVKLSAGDVLLLYTDGTTEARTPQGAFFGEDGLRDAVMAELPSGFEGLLDRLLERLDEFTHRNLDDDVALVALRIE